METGFQQGQKVITPEGSGLITEIIDQDVMVKFDNGESKRFKADDVQDDSSAG